MWGQADLQKLVQMLAYLGIIGPGAYPAHSVVLGAGTNAAPGAAGLLLASNGASTDPSFQTLAALGIQPAGNYVTLPLPANSVGATQISSGAVTDSSIAQPSKLYNRINDIADVRDFGAVGNGTTNDAAAFATNVPSMLVPPSTDNYLINVNTTVTADLVFNGGVITVPAGVTLTINGNIQATSKVLFKGLGTVVINKGEIDIAWFDGTDASSKWAFCARGIQNTNGLGKIVVFSIPSSADAWAITFQISGNNVWGPRWRVDAPIVIDSPQQATVFRTPAGFVATTPMPWMWQLGTSGGALKVDYCHFPDKLSIEGNNGTCTYAGIMYGSSHMRIPYQEIYRTGGWLMQPTQNKQVSDVKFDFIDAGGLYGPILTIDGSAGPNNTITDFVCDFINSTGFAAGHAPNALVQMNSNYHSIKIGKVDHRAVVAGTSDATGAVVSCTNVGATAGNFFSPQYDVCIGPVINGSATITARAIQVVDGSLGAAQKMTGITIEPGSFVNGAAPGGFDVALDYCLGATVQGLRSGRNLQIDSTCTDTQIYGMTPGQVTDAGSNTTINGHNYQPISAVTLTGSPFTYVNSSHVEMEFQIQGASSISTVNYTRGSTTVALESGGTSGSWRISPGDNIAISYGGSPTANIIPR